MHTRLHSAGHLIGNAGETLGWMPIKAHHWPGEGKISFIRGESAQVMEAETLQDQVNQWIAADLPRHMVLDGDSREVGFGDLPPYACGGTHVQALAQVGQVTILGLSEKKAPCRCATAWTDSTAINLRASVLARGGVFVLR